VTILVSSTAEPSIHPEMQFQSYADLSNHHSWIFFSQDSTLVLKIIQRFIFSFSGLLNQQLDRLVIFQNQTI